MGVTLGPAGKGDGDRCSKTNRAVRKPFPTRTPPLAGASSVGCLAAVLASPVSPCGSTYLPQRELQSKLLARDRPSSCPCQFRAVVVVSALLVVVVVVVFFVVIVVVLAVVFVLIVVIVVVVVPFCACIVVFLL